jgi:hypothetical protein
MNKTPGVAAAIFFSAIKIARRTPNAKSVTTPKIKK